MVLTLLGFTGEEWQGLGIEKPSEYRFLPSPGERVTTNFEDVHEANAIYDGYKQGSVFKVLNCINLFLRDGEELLTAQMKIAEGENRHQDGVTLANEIAALQSFLDSHHGETVLNFYTKPALDKRGRMASKNSGPMDIVLDADDYDRKDDQVSDALVNAVIKALGDDIGPAFRHFVDLIYSNPVLSRDSVMTSNLRYLPRTMPRQNSTRSLN